MDASISGERGTGASRTLRPLPPKGLAAIQEHAEWLYLGRFDANIPAKAGPTAKNASVSPRSTDRSPTKSASSKISETRFTKPLRRVGIGGGGRAWGRGNRGAPSLSIEGTGLSTRRPYACGVRKFSFVLQFRPGSSPLTSRIPSGLGALDIDAADLLFARARQPLIQ
jgi:hypothetical protein